MLLRTKHRPSGQKKMNIKTSQTYLFLFVFVETLCLLSRMDEALESHILFLYGNSKAKKSYTQVFESFK